MCAASLEDLSGSAATEALRRLVATRVEESPFSQEDIAVKLKISTSYLNRQLTGVGGARLSVDTAARILRVIGLQLVWGTRPIDRT